MRTVLEFVAIIMVVATLASGCLERGQAGYPWLA